jgi:hypothetical protein
MHDPCLEAWSALDAAMYQREIVIYVQARAFLAQQEVKPNFVALARCFLENWAQAHAVQLLVKKALYN